MKRTCCLLIALLLFVYAIPASAASPAISNILPVAGQRGQTVEVQFAGSRLSDATQVLFHTQGITAGQVGFERNRARATFTIAPDAPLGEHQVRLLTKSGVTEMLTFHVIDRPVVNEDRDRRINDSDRFTPSTSFDEPQMVQLGTTILGRTELEDVDYFGVELQKGEQLTVQVDGMRLGRGFTDSYLAVLNSERFEVAASDDTALLRQDPYVTFLAPEAGRYVIVLRDSGYIGGNNNWYMLHIGTFPRPAAVYPLGGQPGQEIKLRFIGDAAGNFDQLVTLPAQPSNDHAVMPMRDGQQAPSGHAFRVNHLQNVHEADSSQNNTMAQVKPGPSYEVPVAFNGIIEQADDMDYFKLRLTKGQAVTLKCFASSMGSPLDSVVNVFNAKDNKHLQGNDDQGGPDSLVTLTAPEDGEYYVRVRDHRNRGGADFVYRIEATVARPSLSTYMNRYDRNRPQSRQAIAVPRGNRYAALVRVDRSRVGGDLTPVIEGLPTGVSFTGYAPDGRGEMPVVFEVPSDAQLGVTLVDLGVHSPPRGESAERVVGHFKQVTPLVIANPNRTEYTFSTLHELPVAVTEAVPFKIDVVPPQAPLVRDGKMRLKLNVTREGYEGRVRMYLLWRPPGIGGVGMVEFRDGKTEGVYEIDANGGVPTRDWPMVVYGYADLPGGPAWVSSELFELTVEEPFVTGKIVKNKCTQGEQVDVVVNLEHPRQWTGEGELKLLGLPAACQVEPIKITPGQTQATFRITTADNTPAGQHKSLMCELIIQVNGEPVIHRIARGGQIRIDRPRPNRDAQAQQGGASE